MKNIHRDLTKKDKEKISDLMLIGGNVIAF